MGEEIARRWNVLLSAASPSSVIRPVPRAWSRIVRRARRLGANELAGMAGDVQ